MRDVFLEHIYVMYALWFAAGVVLLAYIAYRRKRKNSVKPAVPGPASDAAH
jgi:hypothetical protein